MENRLFDYAMYQVTNSSGEAAFALVELGDFPSSASWSQIETWMQNRINELRQERELGQVLVFTTRVVLEGAIAGLELPRDGGHGPFKFLV